MAPNTVTDPKAEPLCEEPEYDPGSVLEWIKHTEGKIKLKGKSDVALRVKKHLLYIGWDLHYIHKSCNKKELRYRPPPPHHSRAHSSLINACYFLVDPKHHLNEYDHDHESKKRKVEDAGAVDTTCDGDVCLVCHCANDLILCGQCTSPFHCSCIGLEENPKGDWFCPSCCCAICCLKCDSSHTSILTCAQCRRKHHDGCADSSGGNGKWFCSRVCETMYSSLCELVGKKVYLGENNQTWTMHKFNKSSIGDDMGRVFRVMRECFVPIEDPDTGRDIIEDLICSREVDDPNYDSKYQGFYTVVLESNGVMVSVACVRIYQNVAEMALACTGYAHRRLGMYRRLMDELQKRLGKMGVERLVVPAVEEYIETWTGSLGFSKMEISEIALLMKHNLLRFRGTIMCQKVLITDTNL